MEVILLSDVDHVGLRGDVVSVARGYARNYLLPRRLAEEATPARVAELREARRPARAPRGEDDRPGTEIAEALAGTVLRFEVKAGPTGSLFGSVTPTDIADEIWNTKKIRVDRRKIESDPIKRIGRYEIPIGLFEDVRVEVKTEVIPEGGELPSDEELAELEAAERAEQEAEAPEESVELEEILAEVDAAEAAEAEEAAAAEPEAGGVRGGRRDRSASRGGGRARVAGRRRRRPRRGVATRSRGGVRAASRTPDRLSPGVHPAIAAATFTRCPRRCGLRRKFPLRAADFVHSAPSGAPAMMADSPANGQKRPVHKGHYPQGWSPSNPAADLLESPRMSLAPAPTPASVPGAVPPQNLEAEESVLGAMMLSPNAIAAVSEILDASDFYRESHAKIYRAALQLYGKNEPVDAITLTNELEQRGELEDVGGRVRLHELARLVPATRQRRPLRGDRPRDRDAARPHPRRRPDRAARLGPRGRADGARRARRAARLRARPSGAPRASSSSSRTRSLEAFQTHQQPLRVRRRGHRARERLQGSRQAHRRLPARRTS